MKQKIVIKVYVRCDKCRRKSLKVTAEADGVTSMNFEGAEKDRLVVIGESVDAVELTERLRKNAVYATIESVEEVKPPKADEKPKPEEKKEAPPPPCKPHLELYEMVYDDSHGPNPCCTIM